MKICIKHNTELQMKAYYKYNTNLPMLIVHTIKETALLHMILHSYMHTTHLIIHSEFNLLAALNVVYTNKLEKKI